MLILLCVFDFFFFKQKTAYEMRISDWSSDVCSSDLLADREGRHRNSAGHLEDRIEAVDAAQGRRLDGNAEHRNAGHRRDHAGQGRRAARARLDRLQSALGRTPGLGEEAVNRKRTRLKSSHQCGSRMASPA